MTPSSRSPFRLLSLALLSLASCASLAASDVIEDKHVWINTAITGPLLNGQPEPSVWRYMLDSNSQFRSSPGQRIQTTGRFGVGRTLDSRWTLWGGYHFIRNYALQTRAASDENRAFQILQWTDRFGEYTVQSRTRLEERFVVGSHDTGVRFRQQLRVSHPIHAIAPLSWVLWDEVYVHLNDTDYGARRGLDQNRIFAGLNWRWSEIFRSEAGYTYRFTEKHTSPDRVTHALFITLALAFK